MWAALELTIDGVKMGFKFRADIENIENKEGIYDSIDDMSQRLKDYIAETIEKDKV